MFLFQAVKIDKILHQLTNILQYADIWEEVKNIPIAYSKTINKTNYFNVYNNDYQFAD